MPTSAPTPANLQHAAATLRAGGLVAVPTETVYGLAADATNPAAVIKIYETKGRPRFNPLIVHVADLAAAQQLAEFSAAARTLAEACWPGPLTLVAPLTAAGARTIPDLTRAGLPTVALRVPAHPVMQALLQAAGLPLAAPSANRSGHVSATAAAHVAADFGPDLLVLEGGACRLGLESTILDVTTATPTLLRAGALPRAELEALLGQPLIMPDQADPTHPKAPGMLLQHYAPSSPVRLKAQTLQEGEALLAFGPDPLPGMNAAVKVLNLSPIADLAEAATNLFAMLRELDALHPKAIAVMPIPATGLGEALTDRLQRAAAR